MSQDDHGVLPSGTRIADYVVVDVIGRGGFGITYHVRDEVQGADFALKEFYPEDLVLREGTEVRFNGRRNSESDYRWSLKKFHEEAKLLAQFNHANIVRLRRIFEANNSAYMLLDYIRGSTFERWLQSIDGPPTQEELDIVATSLLDALELVHDNRAFHLDISPDNIMIRAADGTPILLDFGASRVEIKRHSHLVSALVVKRGYSAPEQYSSGASHYGAWTDIYAFAATLYRAISGEPPLESTQRVSKDAQLTALQVGHDRYRNDFLEAIDWALTLAAEDRPQSIKDWRVPLLGAKPSRRKVKSAIEHSPTVRLKKPSEQSGPQVDGEIEPKERHVNREDRAHSKPNKGSSRTVVAAAVALLVVGGVLYLSVGLRNVPSNQPALSGVAPPTSAPQPMTRAPVRNEADDAAFTKAEGENVIAAWQIYLASYPNGQHASTARERIAARSQNRFVRPLQGHTSRVGLMTELREGNRIKSIGDNGRIEDHLIFTSISPTLFRTKSVGSYPHAISPDGGLVVVNEGHGALKLWSAPDANSLEDPKELRGLRGHTADVFSMAFSPDGRILLTGAADNTLRLWDTASGRQIRTIRGASRTQVAVFVAFALDGRSFASGSIDKVLKVWNAETGGEIRSFPGHTEPIDAVAISADGMLIASAGRRESLRIWEVASGRLVHTLPAVRSYSPKLAFSKDGRLLATGGGGFGFGEIKLYEVSTGRAAMQATEAKPVSALLFTRDGRHLIAGHEDGQIKLWDATGL